MENEKKTITLKQLKGRHKTITNKTHKKTINHETKK